jgi:hypothetical protein
MNTLVRSNEAEKLSLSLTASDTSGHFVALGLDVGNGAVKLYSSLGETLLESYVLPLSERASHINSGYVEYLDGDRADLIGKQWIGGINAYYQSPTAIQRVTDSKDGKPQLCLQLLLSALSTYAYRPTWDLLVCASVHDGKVFGSAIKAALEGTHTAMIAGKRSTVTIKVAKVLEEGSGVAVTLRSEFDFTNALVYDLGNGTAIVSAFNGLQMSFRDYAPTAGVESLIDAIAISDPVRNYLKQPGDRHLIRTGIEKGDFSYGTRRTEWNFREAYLKALPQWFEQGFKPFVKATETRVPAATAIVAVGGGSCLPGISQILAKKGIAVPQNARWLNAKGLFQVALRSA